MKETHIWKNEIIIPDFKWVTGAENFDVLREFMDQGYSLSKTTLVLSANNDPKHDEKMKKLELFLESFKGFGCILIAKGSSSTARGVNYTDPFYMEFSQLVKRKGENLGVIVNIHESPRNLSSEIERKLSLDPSHIFLQPIISPGMLPAYTKDFITDLANTKELTTSVGVLPITRKIYDVRKTTADDEVRVDKNGQDRYLIRQKEDSETFEEMSRGEMQKTIEFLNNSGLNRPENVYTRVGLGVNEAQYMEVVKSVTVHGYSATDGSPRALSTFLK